jgi:hypothetical protein
MNQSELTQSEWTLREFLDRRERELTERATKLRDELLPCEAELAEIRQVKAALGHKLGSSLAALFLQNATAKLDAKGAAKRTTAAGPDPFEQMTIKGLIVKALDEHFQAGATTQELLEFFRNAWGRDIDRASLSPQMSRLQEEGVVARIDGSKFILVYEAVGEQKLKAWGILPSWAATPDRFKGK